MEGLYEEPIIPEEPKDTGKPPRKTGKVMVALLLAAAIFVSGFVGYVYGYNTRGTAGVAISTSARGVGEIADLQSQVISVAKMASEAVVSIQTESVQYDIFFQPIPQEGLGSGFFISGDGYILTNRHVIEGAQKITVITKDGKRYTAQVIGSDVLSDLAVLKVPVSNAKYLTFRSAATVQVGEFVVAIGNPLGLNFSATFGVLSAKERSIQEPNGALIVDMLQTDAAINPGNSGGPLLDLGSQVIGINTAISSEGQGIGFAVSSDTAVKVINDILKYGYVKWAYLGVVTRDTGEEGVVVVQIAAGSPAEKAGLKVGDVIVELDGNKIQTQEDLNLYIRRKEPGDTAVLVIRRSGSSLTVRVTLGERPRNQ
ncbi:PDZ domain-containing protein [Coprothermobacteraceae bacterium]|nr:PDZ domain-containing protein [Coprothermobacteraceae bacterium]